MRTRAGEESTEHRGDGSTGSNGLHSVDGGSNSNGSSAPSQDSGVGSGRANRGDDRDVTKTPWFDAIEDHAVSDCPGGVCPVPWAINVEPEEDLVNHPSHYTDGGIECIEAIESQLTTEEYRGYLKGNIAKYVWREKHKGGVESLKKAQWYLTRLVELDEAQNG